MKIYIVIVSTYRDDSYNNYKFVLSEEPLTKENSFLDHFLEDEDDYISSIDEFLADKIEINPCSKEEADRMISTKQTMKTLLR